ncbi:zinc ribbon domain-containing protein [Oculatella sp. LEGE 06141]|uniref:zinc ribbon domain-containing protein n=1 Tax=Oculatella sp. LEGE 06141 TaxID=1828648 RepID=UPI001881B8DD|nr:zinc ribbon domain-containing protein [Oculatella sp. LEGE 06141]MBE9179006.1 zinc ribbon domain-containing protein [Oculatella sp. LEGE 06141]
MTDTYSGYTCNLGNGQQLLVENRGQQTTITVSSQSVGQQQSQGSGLNTGAWSAPPTLFQTPSGLVLRLESAEGSSFVQLQGNHIQSLSRSPSLTQAEVVPLRSLAAEERPSAATRQKPMEPMKPLEPMKMGNMEMQMNPMQMRMGDMEMRMGDTSSAQTEANASAKRFCSQCGQSVEVGDRFCAYCGHQLTH